MIEGMYADGVRTFVEVGPGSVLAGLVKRILRRKDHTAISTDRKGGDGIEAFFMALGALVADGRAMNLEPLLAEYRAAVDPSTVKKPRIAIPIDGTNVDKPYPPQLGASGRATPNPETTPEVKVVEKVVDRIVEKVVYKTVPATSNPSSAPAPAAPHSAAAVRSEVSMSNQNTPHPSVQLAWVTAWQETQQQTADAHSAFQRSMADSHAAFLKTAETSFMGLAAVLSGAGVPTVAHAAPQPVTLPSPVAVTPAPRIVPVVAAPAPRAVSVFAAPAPAPVVVPAPIVAPAPVAAPAPAAAGRDLSELMLAVVAEKTGYPAEMLTLDMDLEGDLGVDSIKRVEILSAVQEKAPELAGIDASSLGALRTLGEIVEAMGGSTAAPEAEPAAAPAASAPAATGGQDLSALMLAVVADKTGYPAEMLTLDMDLEGDLGVDSIKRVEILSAVQEQAPELAGIDASSLGALRTLGEIVEAMGGASVSQAVTSSEDPAAGRYAPTPVAAPANGLARRGLPPA
jgi:acyl transferase domain-containing protein